MIPLEVSQGADLSTLVTATFLHAGWWHLAGNMLFLWIFGDNLEEALGRLGFLAFYLVGGVRREPLPVGGRRLPRPCPTIGASGAIAAVMGGYLLLFPRARVDVLVILVVFIRVVPVPAWIMLLVWLGAPGGQRPRRGPAGRGASPTGRMRAGSSAGFVLALPAWLRRGGAGSWAAGPTGARPTPRRAYGALTPTPRPRGAAAALGLAGTDDAGEAREDAGVGGDHGAVARAGLPPSRIDSDEARPPP